LPFTLFSSQTHVYAWMFMDTALHLNTSPLHAIFSHCSRFSFHWFAFSSLDRWLLVHWINHGHAHSGHSFFLGFIFTTILRHVLFIFSFCFWDTLLHCSSRVACLHATAFLASLFGFTAWTLDSGPVYFQLGFLCSSSRILDTVDVHHAFSLVAFCSLFLTVT